MMTHISKVYYHMLAMSITDYLPTTYFFSQSNQIQSSSTTPALIAHFERQSSILQIQQFLQHKKQIQPM